MQYRVIIEESNEALRKKVNELLQQGWELQGGVAITTALDRGQGGALIGQALIKRT